LCEARKTLGALGIPAQSPTEKSAGAAVKKANGFAVCRAGVSFFHGGRQMRFPAKARHELN
jgi:hypothetical protein